MTINTAQITASEQEFTTHEYEQDNNEPLTTTTDRLMLEGRIMGCIIGCRTKEVLFIGTRNEYCTVCARSSASDAKNTVASHKCAKNWTGSSVSMERDAIVEGMLQIIGMHGLVYRCSIADGDSSVHRKLIDAVPCGAARQVEKAERRIHICRRIKSVKYEIYAATSNWEAMNCVHDGNT
ncbi:hypothetical protein PR048_030777 [Dryococelus australis]|uniref:Mutator-like transposase domain-containing protein n=1 Tax=Dryococelus australis TaxID=614101 RepID=A0ABQ9G9V6_9NEOP|nr:hypothetical protein PR048_030777 [Dryococelus australis]